MSLPTEAAKNMQQFPELSSMVQQQHQQQQQQQQQSVACKIMSQYHQMNYQAMQYQAMPTLSMHPYPKSFLSPRLPPPQLSSFLNSRLFMEFLRTQSLITAILNKSFILEEERNEYDLRTTSNAPKKINKQQQLLDNDFTKRSRNKHHDEITNKDDFHCFANHTKCGYFPFMFESLCLYGIPYLLIYRILYFVFVRYFLILLNFLFHYYLWFLSCLLKL